MLSLNFGQDRVRAVSPPDSRTSAKCAQRCDASVFHCTAVCPGPSRLTVTVHVTEPAVHRQQTRSEVALAVGAAGFGNRGGALRIVGEIP